MNQHAPDIAATEWGIREKLVPYLEKLGYKQFRFDVVVPIGSRKMAADLVVYLGDEGAGPYIVVEIKSAVRTDLSLLSPAVQQAYTLSVGLGQTARYVLITDGENHRWFERTSGGRSLVELKLAPRAPEAEKLSIKASGLDPITDPIRFKSLLVSILAALRKSGLPYGLRMAVELNRVLIAKLYDEKLGLEGQPLRFKRTDISASAETASRIEELYREAVIAAGGMVSGEGLWKLSPSTLQEIVDILEPYQLSGVSAELQGEFFWNEWFELLSGQRSEFASPRFLAELVNEMVAPKPGERIIDPACGTGLFLIAAARKLREQVLEVYDGSSVRDEINHVQKNIVGIEINAEVAELAETNLLLNDLLPRQIRRADALDGNALRREEIRLGSYDVVISDPPWGASLSGRSRDDFELADTRAAGSSEILFIERALQLLRPGGRMAIVVPDSILSAPLYLPVRRWLLEHACLKSLASLPPETFAPVGHSGKATVLLLEKMPCSVGRKILVVDIHAVGYDRFGRNVRENDLPDLFPIIRAFHRTGLVQAQSKQDRLRVWEMSPNGITADRFDVSTLDPQGLSLVQALGRARYPAAKLRELASVFSGKNFKEYVKGDQGTAIVIQAGSVREWELDIADAPRIPIDAYRLAERSQIKPGDVLVTTTGAYLGRAAVVEALQVQAVASGAVTIVRPRQEIDPHFLSAVINSQIGREQINRRQASATAQPYIRRSDLGEILIPVPPLEEQKVLAEKIKEQFAKAHRLAKRAKELESEAKDLILSELLGGTQNERSL